MARSQRPPKITGVKGKGLKGLIARAGVSKYLDEFHDRAKDFSPAWGGVIVEFHREEMKVFLKEGAVGGHSRWTPLSPEYKKWKERLLPGGGRAGASAGGSRAP